MSPLAILLVMLLFVLLITNGVERTLKIFPVMVIILGIIFFFGWFSIKYFWLIILVWLISKIFAPKKPKRKTYQKTYYYSNKEAEEMFNEFFRQANSGAYRNSNNSYQQNYGGSGYNSWTVNRDKYYQELGVNKNCTKEELRKAYLKKVKENHPDKFANASEREKEQHEDKLKKINEAYDNLMKDFS
ncbi:MAG: DnaJ domain-containing protein [Fusobacterium sp.]|nr:DnaJ domain-containing protein [Fusobacterium sp.]